MKPPKDLTKILQASLPEEYLHFLKTYESRLPDDPLTHKSWIKGLGTSHFVTGTTMAFRSSLPKFSGHYVIIGYAGKKTIVINKAYEEIDEYVALDSRDGRVLQVDALGTAMPMAENFSSWIARDLKIARLNDLKRLLSRETQSNLTVLIFDDELKAQDARSKILKLQKEGFIDVEDAVVVTRNEDGVTRLHQTQKLDNKGTLTGSITGLLVGSLIAMPLVGAVVGAMTGAIADSLKGVGLNESFVKEIGELLKPGSSAIFTLVKSADADKVTEEFSAFGGTVLFHSVSEEQARALQAILDDSGEGQTG